jgi:hypothetical protein
LSNRRGFTHRASFAVLDARPSKTAKRLLRVNPAASRRNLTVTAAQLHRLAEQAAAAHDFYRRTSPPTARLFKDAAITAQRLAAELARQEQHHAIQNNLDRIKAEFDGPDAA